MVSISPDYPSRTSGLGLLLLRLALSASAGLIALSGSGALLTTGATLIALGLVAGLQTRLFSLAAAILFAAELGASSELIPTLLSSLALLMLGPGAYSVDAPLLGKRIVSIPTHYGD